MARKLKIVGFVVVAIVGGGVLALYLSGEPDPVSMTLISPDKTCRIDVNEHVETFKHWAPIRFLLDPVRNFNDVRFSAFKNDRELINDWLWDDSSTNERFFDLYKPVWVNNSAVRFSLDSSLSDQQWDEVTVLNESSQPVSSLRIESQDIFLILDLQPSQMMKITAPSGSHWVDCMGKFASGKSIPRYGVDFFSNRTNTADHFTQHFCVAVTDPGVTIQNHDFEGYNSENAAHSTVARGDCNANNSNLQR